MINSVQEKNLRGTLIVLLLVASVTAVGAGYSFITDPTGNTIGIPLWYIRYSGFTSYLVPGIVLFVAIGIFGLLTLLTVIARWDYYTWTFSLTVSCSPVGSPCKWY